jgi:hypothetical protein
MWIRQWVAFMVTLSLASLQLAQAANIAIEIPAEFPVRYDPARPAQCFEVRRPESGRITANIDGSGQWDVCIGTLMCPTDCFDSGMRTATAEPLQEGDSYYVMVVSRDPAATGTLAIFETGNPAPGAAVTAGGSPIGCFADQDQRDLVGAHSYADDARACIAFCASKGFKYAAKQAGTHCFCGDSYGRYGASTACVSCRGLTAGDCGGSYANFVWEVAKGAPPAAPPEVPAPPVSAPGAAGTAATGGKPIGCFADREQRDLVGAHAFADDAAACIALCASKGFKYAAKQAGTHCFCGNSYGRYGTSTACVSCRGLTAGDCGGSYANFVWEVAR